MLTVVVVFFVLPVLGLFLDASLHVDGWMANKTIYVSCSV